jgi:hypothetical protein
VIDASVDTSATAPVAYDVGGIGGPAVASVMSDEAT